MNQKPTIPGVDPFTFAGFQWPRHLARMACGPVALRKKWAGRKFCGEYYHAPRPETAGTGRGFYLESDGQPFTRWQWADDAYTSIGHTGWFCDQYGDGDKIRGIVVALPHGRFLAGWSMGEGMASTVDASPVFGSAIDAAIYADRLAERAAEDEREYQAQQTEESEI